MTAFHVYVDPSEQRVELVNEIVVIITIYILMLQVGDFIPDVD